MIFSLIYQKHIKILISYKKKLAPDTTLLEDCIYDLFVELWNRREYLSDTDSIKLYLVRALRRKLTRRLIYRRKETHRTFLLAVGWETPLTPS